MAKSLACPNCGGPITVESAYTTLTVCPYCGSSLYVRDTGVDITGRTAKLAQFPSRLALGAGGQVRGRAFRVLGRIRYQYEDGFWDEWNLQFADGQIGWLEEDEGEFTLTFKRKLTSPIPPFEQITVGSFVPLGGAQMFVSEKGAAQTVGAEGELAQTPPPGRAVRYVDGNAGGKAIRLILDAGGITLHQGEPLEFSELVTAQA
ncbi:MAG TPA: DUF4178 domain-containing protein [Chloroflexia bacterium]|nr:DUF4178 domain-containing protein [Chloroflexia bacterium]